jgi:hypothetical protein
MLVKRGDVGWVLWCRLWKGWSLQEVDWGLSGWTESRSPNALKVLVGETSLVICGMGSPEKDACRCHVSYFDTTGGLVTSGTVNTSGRMVAVGACVALVLAALAMYYMYLFVRFLDFYPREV